MSTRSERYVFSLAGPEDSEALLRILECSDFQGGISVLYTRRPDPMVSFGYEGDGFFVPVIRDLETGEVIAMGCCVVREAYINGRIQRVGYLTGLKVLPAYRNRMPHISKVYAFLHEATRDQVDLYYTTILKDNHEAQRILEKKRPHMPEYRCRGEYTVYCFRTGPRAGKTNYTIETGMSQELDVFYQAQASRMNFSSPTLLLPGITEKDMYTLRDSQGEIVAACAVWNQQGFKQHIVTGYSGIYRLLKKLPLGLLGYPDFPEAAIPVNYACITGLCVKGDDPDLARDLINEISLRRTDVSLLLMGLFENHPLEPVFKHIRHIRYASRMYTVHWPGQEIVPDERPFNIEVGLL